jgi:SAM-dependent methyltransferase
LSVSAQTPPSNVVYLSYDDAKPVFQALEQELPPPTLWSQSIAKRDNDIRARVQQGDEGSLINLLLFGTSFTREPRITSRHIEAMKQATGHASTENRINQILDARMNDLMRVLTEPRNEERLLFARRVLSGEKNIKSYFAAALARRLDEEEGYTRILEMAQALNEPSKEFAERSRIYRTRGLSSDTSFRTNLAIEEALERLKERGTLRPRVARVGIVGPGLDFIDKQEGFDFYPQQTIQPFAVMNSLLRLGLANARDLQITTFDLSLTVNDHIERLGSAARRGSSYVMQLPLDAGVSWTTALVSYWKTFGGEIGAPTTPVAIPPTAGAVKIRAVRVQSAFAARLTPIDLNIVWQHLELEESEKFDLIVGTNIFVYYDRPEQGLAMMNIAKMLKPGGILLSNNALLDLPATRMNVVGYSKTLYSDRSEDGDLVIWYQLQPLP